LEKTARNKGISTFGNVLFISGGRRNSVEGEIVIESEAKGELGKRTSQPASAWGVTQRKKDVGLLIIRKKWEGKKQRTGGRCSMGGITVQ